MYMYKHTKVWSVISVKTMNQPRAFIDVTLRHSSKTQWGHSKRPPSSLMKSQQNTMRSPSTLIRLLWKTMRLPSTLMISLQNSMRLLQYTRTMSSFSYLMTKYEITFNFHEVTSKYYEVTLICNNIMGQGTTWHAKWLCCQLVYQCWLHMHMHLSKLSYKYLNCTTNLHVCNYYRAFHR